MNVPHVGVQTHKPGRRERPPFNRASGTDRTKKKVAGNPSHLEDSAHFIATLTLTVGQIAANPVHTQPWGIQTPICKV